MQNKEPQTQPYMERIIITGATSGIGYQTAKLFLKKGHMVGIAGRRGEKLRQIADEYPGRCHSAIIDITEGDAALKLSRLIDEMGGMDIYLHISGVGAQNQSLDPETELNTVETNCVGFTRMITAACNYFVSAGGGHIAVVSSIAGTKGLGAAPSYSATKRYQNIYIDALSQLASIKKCPIRFTDIRPGFVDTPLLKQGSYPMLMTPGYVAGRIYKAIKAGKRRVTIDWRYKILVCMWRLIPEFIWERLPVGRKKENTAAPRQ